MDGGGSSTMVVEGDMINDNDNRKVFSAVMFYAKAYNLEYVTPTQEEPLKTAYSDFLASNITPNFTYKEVACNNNDELYLDAKVWAHAKHMQELRDYLGVPIKVNSWFRTVEYNKAVKGHVNSKHLKGIATDIAITGATQTKAIKWWKAKGYGGIGHYKTFTHLDSRGYLSEWWG